MKKFWLPVAALIVLVGIFAYININPPVETGTIVISGDGKAALTGIGNKGFAKIKVKDVTVNHGEEPAEKKMQIGDAFQGFILRDEPKNEAGYEFVDIRHTIETGSSPSAHLDKLNEGTASGPDDIYAVSVWHQKRIHTIHITYTYFGLSFEETVSF